MKISEIEESDVAAFLRIEKDDYVKGELVPYMTAAKSFLESYTKIPATSDQNVETLDSHEDFYIAYMVLCQDMYDNRSYSYLTHKGSVNKVVTTILDMHRKNLVG